MGTNENVGYDIGVYTRVTTSGSHVGPMISGERAMEQERGTRGLRAV